MQAGGGGVVTVVGTVVVVVVVVGIGVVVVGQGGLPGLPQIGLASAGMQAGRMSSRAKTRRRS